jgi:hypothetical protein
MNPKTFGNLGVYEVSTVCVLNQLDMSRISPASRMLQSTGCGRETWRFQVGTNLKAIEFQCWYLYMYNEYGAPKYVGSRVRP